MRSLTAAALPPSCPSPLNGSACDSRRRELLPTALAPAGRPGRIAKHVTWIQVAGEKLDDPFRPENLQAEARGCAADIAARRKVSDDSLVERVSGADLSPASDRSLRFRPSRRLSRSLASGRDSAMQVRASPARARIRSIRCEPRTQRSSLPLGHPLFRGPNLEHFADDIDAIIVLAVSTIATSVSGGRWRA